MNDGFFKAKMVGDDRFPRYVIRDDRRPTPERFWTGSGWTAKIGKAMRFADPSLMFGALFRLTKRHFARLYHERRYRLKVNVSVYGPGHVTQAEVEDYIRKALVFRLDYEKHGTGPTDDTMVLVNIPGPLLTAVEWR